MLQQLVNFLFAIKLSFIFKKVWISTNYEKIILKLVLAIALRLGTFLHIVSEINITVNRENT